MKSDDIKEAVGWWKRAEK